MRLWNRLRSWSQTFLRRSRIEREMDAELQSHIEAYANDLIRNGVPQEEAMRRARMEFGGIERVKEECRESRGIGFIETLRQDARFGLRMLRKSPGFTTVALLTLAVGIGANTAIFSMVNGVILHSLSYRQPEQLYLVNENVPQLTSQSPWGPWFLVNGGNFMLWQGHCPAVSSMALVGPVTFNMTGHGIPQQIEGVRVSANFLDLMGIRPQLGRAFLPQEDELGHDQEVILTAQSWRELFNSNPGIIGQSIVLDNAPYTVVGIAPDGFRFPQTPGLGSHAPELFKPIGFRRWESWAGPGGFNFEVIARLNPGSTPKQALAQLNVIEAGIAQRGDAHRGIAPGQFDLKAMIRPLQTAILGDAQSALWMLMTAAFFVLLIICLNLANLMLVRNMGRAHEVGVRSALGASRRRLVCQFFVEGLILAVAGGVLGLVFARSALQMLVRNAPFSIPRVSDIHIDPGVLLFTVGITLVTAVLFALLPTARLANANPLEALSLSGRIASGSPHSVRLRGGLVVSQVALCGVLLAGALLLIESLVHVARANQWMDEEHVLALDLALPPNESNSLQQADQFFSNVLGRVRILLGVRNVGFTSKLPLLGDSFGDDIDFQEAPHSADKVQVGEFRFVSPGYFETIGLPLVKGRLLSESDHDKDVALISETVANKFLRGRDPIGMHLLWSGNDAPKPREIIGVVGDVRNTSDQVPVTAVYVPLWTYDQMSETLVVRTAMDPGAVAESIRRAIWSVEPQVAIPAERTLQEVVLTSEAARRYESFLGAIFAVFAVLLAAIGLYGVISYSVGERTHEIGIRMALGAQRGDLMRLVVGQGTKLALLGVGIGVLAAFGLTRFMASLLFGVSATDPLTFAAVAILLVSIALLACYVPARRAMRVDPIAALRHE